jgi:hypothetical protein
VKRDAVRIIAFFLGGKQQGRIDWHRGKLYSKVKLIGNGEKYRGKIDLYRGKLKWEN